MGTLAEVAIEEGAAGGALEPGLAEGEDETGDPAAKGMDAEEHPEGGEIFAAGGANAKGDGKDPEEGDDDGKDDEEEEKQAEGAEVMRAVEEAGMLGGKLKGVNRVPRGAGRKSALGQEVQAPEREAMESKS